MSFDRIRPRDPLDQAAPPTAAADTDGRRALFSTEPPIPALGSVAVDCATCGETSVIGLRQALRAAFPSVHLPILKKGYSSWMRCPACGLHTWVKVSIRL